MQKICNIEILENIIEQYDAFLIDLWGVVHNGISAYKGVVECLNSCIANNRKIIFMTNAPRPGNVILKKLIDLKIHATIDMMLTSGDIARMFMQDTLSNFPNKKYYHLGALQNIDILQNLNLNIIKDLTQAEIVLLTVHLDEGENLDQYDDLLKQAANLQIPLICPNPDQTAIHGNKIFYCPGFFAKKYEQFGGSVQYYGKPYLPIYTVAFERLYKLGISDRKRILMVGDTLGTDIQGAVNAGIDSALVLTGNAGKLLKAGNLEQACIASNLYPTYILNSFIF